MRTIAPELQGGERLVAGALACAAAKGRSARALLLTSEGRVLAAPLDGSSIEAVGVAHHMAEETGEKMLRQRIEVDGPFVAIVSDLGLFGTVLSLDESSFALGLFRADHHADQCSFPIAFVTRRGRRCLVHGTGWNRLDVTDLESQRLLTERHIDADRNLHYVDYFHASIQVSPDGRTLLSNGWVAHPFDVRMTWKFDDFMDGYEPCGLALDGPVTSGSNWSRPLCFLDDTHIAWGYNARENPRSGASAGQASELIVQSTVTSEVVDRVPFDFFALGGESSTDVAGALLFDASARTYTTFSSRHDVVVTDGRGHELARSKERLDGACVGLGLGYRLDDNAMHLTPLPAPDFLR